MRPSIANRPEKADTATAPPSSRTVNRTALFRIGLGLRTG